MSAWHEIKPEPTSSAECQDSGAESAATTKLAVACLTSCGPNVLEVRASTSASVQQLCDQCDEMLAAIPRINMDKSKVQALAALTGTTRDHIASEAELSLAEWILDQSGCLQDNSGWCAGNRLFLVVNSYLHQGMDSTTLHKRLQALKLQTIDSVVCDASPAALQEPAAEAAAVPAEPNNQPKPALRSFVNLFHDSLTDTVAARVQCEMSVPARVSAFCQLSSAVSIAVEDW